MSNEGVEDLQLRVAKAIPRDVGHGRARVPFDNDLKAFSIIGMRFDSK